MHEQNRLLKGVSKDDEPEHPEPVRAPRATADPGRIHWVKFIIPILISSTLSAAMTGVGTVSSISRELAVDHASVQIMIQDHDRRISKLEHDIVPRSEHDEKDKALSENLQNMQDQLKQANSNIDEIRKFMIDQYSTRKR